MAPRRVEALFCDPRRHLAALAVLAAEHLQEGDYAAAFRYADRRCRLVKPSARDYLLRSEASRRAGFPHEAIRDLQRAIELDPTDKTVLRIALDYGGPEQKIVAAALLEADDAAPSRVLRREGDGFGAVRAPKAVFDAEVASVSIVVPVYEDFEATRACFEALFEQGGETPARIIAVDDASPNISLRTWLDEQAAESRLVLLRNEANLGFAASVNRALALCPTGDVILLNADALPPPGSLARLGAVAHSAPGIGTVTPLSNNGEYTSFPAPNVLNPLPALDEIARLDRLAHEANGADFVDLPNGIGFCLYISRACLDAVGPLPEIYARGYFEDVEFCLRAREKGFRNVCATGIYVGHAGGRSFGAQKRRLVMRNLAILDRRFPDYRLESASFLEADPLRAARCGIEMLSPNTNPTVLLVCAEGASLFLARERARELASDGRASALVCSCDLGGGVSLRGAGEDWPQSLGFRLDDKAGLSALLAYLRASKIIRIELFDPLSVPVSLLLPLFRFGVPVDRAAGDLEWVVAIRRPFAGACATPDEAAVCSSCAENAFSARDDAGSRNAHLVRKRKSLSRAKRFRPLDRMAEVFVRQIFGDSSVVEEDHLESKPSDFATPLARHGAARVLAVIMPLPDPMADRLTVALGRAMLKKDETARIVVLGACVNDLAVMATGNVFVAGAVETDEYERLLRQYEASALMTPYRTRFFGWTDRLSRRFTLPQAYFDYSMGKLPRTERDFALDPRLCDQKAAAGLADWFISVAAGAAAP